ncbi:MAG TPA: hypothetical protein VM266_03665, partial [Solirubrobacteraceae bacterium]|nr:hypothetical protein [Solirubrobacteraceae bacterium]
MLLRLAATVAAVACSLVLAPAASAAQPVPRELPPAWYTVALAEQVHSAGAGGVQVAAEYLNTECPGYQSPGVQAAGCIVAPYGCTANFIYTDGTSKYVGTAAHCVDKVGQPVVMQVDTTTLAEVGTVSYRSAQEEPGDDFAIIKIYPDVASKWGVNPAIPVVGGPNGIYTGCGPELVKNYGHGYGVAVAQGKPEGGLALVWHDDGYGWEGVAAPGDSGDAVVTSAGLAAGNLTHLIIYDRNYTPSTVAGTRITKILTQTGLQLVNADGSTTGAASTSCGGSTTGGTGGGGGGNGGGNGGGKPKG